MKKSLRFFLPLSRCSSVLLLAVFSMELAHGQPIQQPKMQFTPGAAETWNATWQGVAGRTYFPQWSPDLVTWNYMPHMEFGTGAKSLSVPDHGASQFFMRLQHVDDPSIADLTAARNADFDRDGFSNAYEIETLGTSPLLVPALVGDSDQDGLLDSWEIQYFGNLSQIANADPDGDGVNNQEEFINGSNPNHIPSTAPVPIGNLDPNTVTQVTNNWQEPVSFKVFTKI
ncbi:MAG: hypothetical protein HC845_04630 [Akkermansiaceae bacterium]|nr:hypothetical protein [Akkermansiaceae bacterium]